MDSTETRSDADLLSGWKEIASYLGKSVRSAQRWEADYRLPVHRITTPDGGHLIYATRSEIDAWRLELKAGRLDDGSNGVDLPEEHGNGNGSGAAPSDLVDDGAPSPGAPLATALPAVGRRSHVLIASMALNVALLVTTAWLAWPARLVPARFELHGTMVRAMSASERTVWQHDFGGPVRSPHSLGNNAVFETDLDGDGTLEVIAVLRVNASGPRGLTESDRIVAFRRDGRLLWTVQPTHELRDAERTYTGPWMVRAVAVDGRRVAAGFSHPAWRPNFVVEIDAKGQTRVRYVQGGWVQGLAYWRTPRGLALAIGGETGDLKGASLAIIDADGPGGREQAAPERALTCRGCPNAPARELYLFPNGDVTKALFRPWGLVSAVRPRGADLGIWIAADSGLLGAVAFLTADGRIREYSAALAYWEAHGQLYEDRRMDHPAEACPERSRPVVIRRWTPETQWTELAVASQPGRQTP